MREKALYLLNKGREIEIYRMNFHMAESPAQAGISSTEEAGATTTEYSGSPADETQQTVPAPPIIWTPRRGLGEQALSGRMDIADPRDPGPWRLDLHPGTRSLMVDTQRGDFCMRLGIVCMLKCFDEDARG